jgi:hypothetical protein
MFYSFVPDPLASLVRSVVQSAPAQAYWPLFAFIVACYAFSMIKIVSVLWCWLDYQIATALRRVGPGPLFLQYPAGDIMEAAPKWAARFGKYFVIITLAWQAASEISKYSSPTTFPPLLGWFLSSWRTVLLAVKG